jgi:hypothetical protein
MTAVYAPVGILGGEAFLSPASFRPQNRTCRERRFPPWTRECNALLVDWPGTGRLSALPTRHQHSGDLRVGCETSVTGTWTVFSTGWPQENSSHLGWLRKRSHSRGNSGEAETNGPRTRSCQNDPAHSPPEHITGCGVFSDAEVFAMAAEQSLRKAAADEPPPVDRVLSTRPLTRFLRPLERRRSRYPHPKRGLRRSSRS